MDIRFPNERDDFERQQRIETNKDGCNDNKPIHEMELSMENNMSIKAAMVTELVDMGLSLKAIERILHLEPEVLDRLL